jgi:hypothetical protein
MSINNTAEGKYIYCFIKTPDSFKLDINGLSGQKIRLINWDNLAAVVSDSPIKEYSITRENSTTHLKVIEEVMRLYSPVLPVSFGTVACNNEVILKDMLQSKQIELQQTLGQIEGKVELGLKAIWLDMPKIFQKIVSENPVLEQKRKDLAGKILNRDEAITVGKFVANEIEARKELIKKNILSLLYNLIVDYKEIPLLGQEMILNLAFLVPENQQKIFDQIIHNLDNTYEEENIYFKYVGPVPPFNFVQVPISLS